MPNENEVVQGVGKEGLERELSELRREVLEARNLVIKSDNLLKNLHSDLKVVGKRQEEQAKRARLSSAAAYILFVLLGSLAAFGITRASVAVERAKLEVAKAESEKAQSRSAEVETKLDESKKEQLQIKVESERALTAYRTLGERDLDARVKGLEQAASLERDRLTPLELKALDDRGVELRAEYARVAVERAKVGWLRGDYRGVVNALKRLTVIAPGQGDAQYAAWLLGMSLHKLRDYKEAVAPLEVACANPKNIKNGDLALLALAQSYEETNQPAKAIETLQRGMQLYPASINAPLFIARLRALQRASSAPPTQAAPQP